MKYLIFTLIVSQIDTAVPTVTTRSISAPTDDQACKVLGDIALKMQPELPKTIDQVTRLDGVVVLCSLKTFANNKTVLLKIGVYPLDPLSHGVRSREHIKNSLTPSRPFVALHGLAFSANGMLDSRGRNDD